MVLGDPDDIKLAKTVEECRALGSPGHRISSKRIDTRDPDTVHEFIAFAVTTFGRIDYCTNCERPDGLAGQSLDIDLAEFSKFGPGWQRGVSFS